MILTNLQNDFLKFISNDDLSSKIYFTWWTALAYYYNHRLSTDLDFFSFDFLANYEILPFINKTKKHFWSQKVNYQNIRNRNIFIFDKKMENLKIELTFFPFQNIWKYTYFNKNLKIDSILDIAINKIHAVSERLEIKDLYDIYFILQNENFKLQDLIFWVEKKFWVELNKTDIIARLLYLSNNLESIQPFLIQKINLNKIKKFFENLV